MYERERTNQDDFADAYQQMWRNKLANTIEFYGNAGLDYTESDLWGEMDTVTDLIHRNAKIHMDTDTLDVTPAQSEKEQLIAIACTSMSLNSRVEAIRMGVYHSHLKGAK